MEQSSSPFSSRLRRLLLAAPLSKRYSARLQHRQLRRLKYKVLVATVVNKFKFRLGQLGFRLNRFGSVRSDKFLDANVVT